MRIGYFKRGRTRCVDTMISQNSNGVGLIFHIRRLMANFRKLLGSSQKFFKAHPTIYRTMHEILGLGTLENHISINILELGHP